MHLNSYCNSRGYFTFAIIEMLTLRQNAKNTNEQTV